MSGGGFIRHKTQDVDSRMEETLRSCWDEMDLAHAVRDWERRLENHPQRKQHLDLLARKIYFRRMRLKTDHSLTDRPIVGRMAGGHLGPADVAAYQREIMAAPNRTMLDALTRRIWGAHDADGNDAALLQLRRAIEAKRDVLKRNDPR